MEKKYRQPGSIRFFRTDTLLDGNGIEWVPAVGAVRVLTSEPGILQEVYQVLFDRLDGFVCELVRKDPDTPIAFNNDPDWRFPW